MTPALYLGGIALMLSQVSLGGAVYEHFLIDPVWPQKPELVQPRNGGIHRARFWIPVHVLFELSLITLLVLEWSNEPLKQWLLLALASHLVMRIWSAVYFIPKAIAFENASSILPEDAKRWTRLSLGRLPLAILTSFSLFIAFYEICQHTQLFR